MEERTEDGGGTHRVRGIVLSGAPERAQTCPARVVARSLYFSRSPGTLLVFYTEDFFELTSSRETCLARVLPMRTRVVSVVSRCMEGDR